MRFTSISDLGQINGNFLMTDVDNFVLGEQRRGVDFWLISKDMSQLCTSDKSIRV